MLHHSTRQSNPGINWYPSAKAYSIFGQGLAEVIRAEKSHEFTGFVFQTTNLSTQNLIELHALERLLASDPYYFETGKFGSTRTVKPYGNCGFTTQSATTSLL